MQIKRETTVGVFILISLLAFLYMGYKIGSFRFSKANYAPYSVSFKNVSGLTKKADVRIAGVKVGWVESFKLSKDASTVLAEIMIARNYKLSSDTQAYIRQDGLLGIKFVEILPGSSLEIPLNPGDNLNNDLSKQQGSFEELVYSLTQVAQNIEDVTGSLKTVLTDKDSLVCLKETIKSTSEATQKISAVSSLIEQLINQNQNQLNQTIRDLQELINSIKDNFPVMAQEISALSQKINKNTDTLVSSISDTSKTLKNQFLPDISKNTNLLVKNFQDSTESVKKAADNISDISDKIKNNVFFSKLINNNKDSVSLVNNFSTIISTARACSERISNFTYGIDNNYEPLFGPDKCNNFKSLLNFWFHPNDYCFLLGGLTFSKNGFVSDKKLNFCSENSLGKHTDLPIENIKRKLNSLGFNLQVGGYLYNNFGLRLGFFESTPGVALDCFVPTFTDRLKLVSSFEVFDFTGKNRIIKDNRPHLKWMNRLYFSPNFYLSFGADDFASKCNKSAFVGVGINFGDTFYRSIF